MRQILAALVTVIHCACPEWKQRANDRRSLRDMTGILRLDKSLEICRGEPLRYDSASRELLRVNWSPFGVNLSLRGVRRTTKQSPINNDYHNFVILNEVKNP